MAPQGEKSKPTLAYWNIRGLAQPARLMLAYAGIDFNDKRYHQGLVGTDGFKQAWKKEKFGLGLDLPNLPYFIDGDLKLTQSNAIYRYIATKANLRSSNNQDQGVEDMLGDQVMDMRNMVVRLVYTRGPPDDTERKQQGENFSAAAKAQRENFSKSFMMMENFLKKHEGPWLLGKRLCYADFHLYEMCYQVKVMWPDFFSEMPLLGKHRHTFEDPKSKFTTFSLKKYMASGEYLKFPFNSKHAAFGGHGSPGNVLSSGKCIDPNPERAMDEAF